MSSELSGEKITEQSARLRIGRFEGEKTSIYSVRGNRGVLLELSEPQRICGLQSAPFILGTNEPERLAAAIGASLPS